MNRMLVFAAVCLPALAQAQVPNDVMLVSGIDANPTYGVELSGAQWVPNPFAGIFWEDEAPSGLAFDAGGDLYVTVEGYDQVWRYDAVTGAQVEILLTPDGDDARFLAERSTGTVLVCNQDRAVWELDPIAGTQTILFTGPNMDPGPFGNSTFDAFEADDSNVYGLVSLGFFNPSPRTVQRFSYSGALVETLTTPQDTTNALGVIDGDILVGMTDSGSPESFSVARFASGVATWTTVVQDRPTDIDLGPDGFVWVLSIDNSITRLDPATGAHIDEVVPGDLNPWLDPMSLVDNEPAVLARGPGASAPDECPDNAAKTEPGVCGCDYYDVPATVPTGTACQHITATVDPSTELKAGVYVESHANVGSGGLIGVGSTIATRATVGNATTIGASTTISRLANIGDSNQIGDDVLFGRSTTTGSGVTVGNNTTVGYGTGIPSNSQIGTDVMLGSLVNMPLGPVFIGVDGLSGSAIIARGVTLGQAARIHRGAIIGPDVTVGASSTVGGRSRIRKGVEILDDVTIGDDVRIGRETQLLGSQSVGDDATIGARATVLLGVCVAPNESVADRTTVSTGVCP